VPGQQLPIAGWTNKTFLGHCKRIEASSNLSSTTDEINYLDSIIAYILRNGDNIVIQQHARVAMQINA
jgi:hypothetical protein